MTMNGLGILGIGYPSMGLGTYGLGAAGGYGSYDDYMPSMMGMTNPMMMGMGSGIMGMDSMMGMGGMNSMMGMGMYNPLYYTQMQSAAEQIQAQHAGQMHATLLHNEVNGQRESDSALIQKMLTNGTIKYGIRNLYAKVVEGDQDGICKEFTELQNYINLNYENEIKAMGRKTPHAPAAADIIENLYASYVTAQNGGQIANLREDILRYGETSTKNGFMSGFRKGHSKKYVDHTLNYCFGMPINQKESKDKRKEVASYAGRTASVVEKGVYGAAAGVTLYGIGKGIANGLSATFSSESAKAARKATKEADKATAKAAKEAAEIAAREAAEKTIAATREGAGIVEQEAAEAAQKAAKEAAQKAARLNKPGLFKKLGKYAWIGAIAGAALDIFWQISDSKQAA